MLSRATAGLAGRTVILALPGSEHAVRLAMEKLVLPELGPPRARGTTLMGYRPDRKTIPIDEARAILAVHGEPVAGLNVSQCQARQGASCRMR